MKRTMEAGRSRGGVAACPRATRPLGSARGSVWIVAGAILWTLLAPRFAAACPDAPVDWATITQGFFLAAGPSGKVYVADPLGHRVLMFGPDGAPLGGWGSQGSAHGQFSTPGGVAVDGAGNVYVADTGNSRIEVFDADGSYLRSISHVGIGSGLFLLPLDIALGTANDLFIVDAIPASPMKILRYGLDDSFLGEWTVTVSPSPSTVLDIAADNGEVFVFETTSQTPMRVFSPAGVPLRSWSPALNGESWDAGSMAVHGGIVCVSLLTDTGIELRSFDALGVVQCTGVPCPGGALATGADGSTYVMDDAANRILRFTGIKTPVARPTWGGLKALYR